jgi:3-deoxy-D-manno-octulosonate 8-phosphate phosphatase KdsC-like HAD superfamily phosphatase
VRGAARAVTSTPGGNGAIREIASWILGPSL